MEALGGLRGRGVLEEYEGWGEVGWYVGRVGRWMKRVHV